MAVPSWLVEAVGVSAGKPLSRENRAVLDSIPVKVVVAIVAAGRPFARLEDDAWGIRGVLEATLAVNSRLVGAAAVLAPTPVEIAIVVVVAGKSLASIVADAPGGWLVGTVTMVVTTRGVWIVVAAKTVVTSKLVETTVVAADNPLTRLLAASLPESSAYLSLNANTKFSGTSTSVAFPKTIELFS